MINYDDKTCTKPNRRMSIKSYRKWKLKTLKREFRINITEEEAAHAETLTTEAQIDQFIIGMMNKYWG